MKPNWSVIIVFFLLGMMFTAVVSTARCEDLLSRQSGTAIPPGVWTQFSPGGPVTSSIVYLSYDNFEYNPVTQRTYTWQKYKSTGSENNETLFGYNAASNRLDIIDRGNAFHSAYFPEAGHMDNRMASDPVTGLIWTMNGGGSGSSATDLSYVNWMYDPVGQTSRTIMPLLKTGGTPAEISARVDYTRGSVVLVGNTQGIQEYNIANNTWGAAYCNPGPAGCPPAGLLEACMVWSTAEQAMYVFGGEVSGTPRNTLYRIKGGASTQITTSGSVPAARSWPGCAYDTRHNLLLVYGGCSTSQGCNPSTVFTDTSILDLDTLAWSAGPSPGPVADANAIQAGQKLVYDESMDAFILGTSRLGASQWWALRLYSGQKFGYRTGEDFSRLGGNFSVNTDGWTKGGTIASNGTEVVIGWDEAGRPSDTTIAYTDKSYAATVETGSKVMIPSPANSNGILSQTNAPMMSEESIAYVGSTKWMCFSVRTSATAQLVYAGSYSGSAWANVGAVGIVNIGGNNVAQGHCVMLNVNSVPTVVFTELDKINSPPYRTFVYAKQWNGSVWSAPLGGTFFNRTNSTTPFLPKADGVSATYKSGNDFLIAWSEYNSINSLLSNSPANVFVSCWCSGAITPYPATTGTTGTATGSWNVAPGSFNAGNPPSPANSGSSAYNPSIAWISPNVYVALVERTNGTPMGMQKVYIRTSANNGATITTLAGPLNIDPLYGWATSTSLVASGTNLFLSWTESGMGPPWTSSLNTYVGGFGNKARVYAAQITTAGVVSNLGGMLNSSPDGSAQESQIAMVSTVPVVVWGEVILGTMRQLNASQWDGKNWLALGGFAPPAPGGSNISGKVIIGGKVAQ